MTPLPQLKCISWSEFHNMAFELAQQLTQLRLDVDQIVSIARGGHVLSRILSDFLDLPIFSVSIQSYEAFQQHELRITQELAPELIRNHVLLVDEIVDSGKTLARALEYLSELGAATVTSVALHVKTHAICKADFYVEETDKWIVYPYEVRETVNSLMPIWKEAGLTQAKLADELKLMGLNPDFISIYTRD